MTSRVSSLRDMLTRSLDPLTADEQFGVHGGLALVGRGGVVLGKVVSEGHYCDVDGGL